MSACTILHGISRTIGSNPPRQTTRETLDRVKDLQVEIGTVQNKLTEMDQKLDQILLDVKEDKCINTNSLVEQEINKLTPLWLEYYKGETSVLGMALR